MNSISTNPYIILGLPIGSSIDEVKKVYKSIALKSHPDKINNISDINEKNKRIKEFIDSTNAYNKILKGDFNYNDDFNDDYNYDDYSFSFEDWEETINNIRQSDLFKDVVSMIMKFKSKVKKHNIKVDIKYSDYFSNHKKKLRLFLKSIEEPIYINLDCKKYPSCIINYFDDNDNEHEITIQMILINDKIINNDYYHIDDIEDANANNKINIYYNLKIDTIDYLIGNTKEIQFFNKESIKVDIKPFAKEFIINNYGINKGDLIILFDYQQIKIENWNKLSDADRTEFIRILKLI